MIISFIFYFTLSIFVHNSFPQCNCHTIIQGGSLAFKPLDGYLNLSQFHYYGTLSLAIQK